MNLYNKDLLTLSDFSYWESKKLYTQLMEKCKLNLKLFVNDQRLLKTNR